MAGSNEVTYTVKCTNGDGSGTWSTKPAKVKPGGKLVIVADSSTPGITVGGFDSNVIANIPQPDPPATESIGSGSQASFNIKGGATDGSYSFVVTMNATTCVFHNDQPTFTVDG